MVATQCRQAQRWLTAASHGLWPMNRGDENGILNNGASKGLFLLGKRRGMYVPQSFRLGVASMPSALGT